MTASRRAAASTVVLIVLAAAVARAQTQQQIDRIRSWNPKVGEIRTPGEIQAPKGTFQTPGEIQVPRGIRAVAVIEGERCRHRLSVGADALFAFDQWTLSPQAEETLVVVLPEIEKAGRHPVSIEGHTDAKGGDAYNDALSEKRASTVKQWLVTRRAVPEAATVVGYGEKRPVAPNAKPDGSDDPEGRQKNRRVEIVIDTCG